MLSKYITLLNAKDYLWKPLFLKMAYDFFDYTASHYIDPFNSLIGRVPSSFALKYLKLKNNHNRSFDETLPRDDVTILTDMTSVDVRDREKRLSIFGTKRSFERYDGRRHLKLIDAPELQCHILRWAALNSYPARVVEEILEVAANIRHVCRHQKGELVAVSVACLPYHIRYEFCVTPL